MENKNITLNKPKVLLDKSSQHVRISHAVRASVPQEVWREGNSWVIAVWLVCSTYPQNNNKQQQQQQQQQKQPKQSTKMKHQIDASYL